MSVQEKFRSPEKMEDNQYNFPMSGPLLPEEEHLLGILKDRSGIDIMQFLQVDESQPDRCKRARPYQYAWFRSYEKYEIDHCSRDIGKSFGSIARALAWPFCFPGQDILYTAPELNHLRPLTDKIEEGILGSRLLRSMLPGDGSRHSGSIVRQPAFGVRFVNGAKIITRLPGKTGRGMKGQHALAIEVDEGQDFPDAGYVEIIESMKSSQPGAQFKLHGVSNGDNGRFDTYLNSNDPNLAYKKHRFIAMDRPDWNDGERRDKISEYKGEDTIDYGRNLFGNAGSTQMSLFSQRRLMACVRTKESAWAVSYNRDLYRRIKISEEHLRDGRQVLEEVFELLPPEMLGSDYLAYYGGMDVGFTRDPTEILIFGLTYGDTLRLLLRVHLARVSAPDQAFVVGSIFRHFGHRLESFGMDRTGVGLPVYQQLTDPYGEDSLPAEHRARIVGYAANEKVPVGLDDRALLPYETEDDLIIYKNVTAWGFDAARQIVDSQGLELPYDNELLAEFQGEIALNTKGGESGAVRKRSGHKVSLHTFDAFLMALAARELPDIARKLFPGREDVLESF